MIGVGLMASLLVLGAVFLDEGEVVTLVTRDASGREFETDLWIVDLGAETYVRAGRSEVAWLRRLRADPLVELERAGRQADMRAAVVVDDGALAARVAQAMAEKYGLADRMWGRWGSPSRTVAIRLLPAPGHVAAEAAP